MKLTLDRDCLMKLTLDRDCLTVEVNFPDSKQVAKAEAAADSLEKAGGYCETADERLEAAKK